MSNLKILHAPTTVGGNPQSLSKAERNLGYESYSVALEQNYINYDVDKIIFKKGKSYIFQEFYRWKEIFRLFKKYNVIHYNYGQTLAPTRSYPSTNSYPHWKILLYSDVYSRILELLDLKIAYFFKKVIAITYQGDDARQGAYCREKYLIHFAHEVSSNYYSKKGDELKKKRIDRVNKYVDLIYAVNPDLLNVLPKRAKFIPYANIDPKYWIPVWGEENPEIPHIVHAPSHREVKGTKYIIEALEKLKAEGVTFKYTLVENMSHQKARKIYETADLLVDQLLAGYYGGLAVEFMALGKPVICYMREEDMHYLPSGMWDECPIINATPETIYEVLKDWITTRKKELLPLGKKSRTYIEKWHDPIKIAKAITHDYECVYFQKKGG